MLKPWNDWYRNYMDVASYYRNHSKEQQIEEYTSLNEKYDLAVGVDVKNRTLKKVDHYIKPEIPPEIHAMNIDRPKPVQTGPFG